MINLPKLAKIIILIIFTLLLIQVIVANRLTSDGITLNRLESEGGAISEENQLLEREIATSSSLTKIAVKAEEAGFTKAQPLFLVPEVPVAAGFTNVNASR